MPDTVQSQKTEKQNPPASPKAFKKNGLASGKSLFILVSVLLVAAIGGLLWYLHASQYETTDDATLEGHVHPVAPRVGGTVIKVLVDDNQMVQKGQTLAVIDSQDYQLALSEAQHNLLNAQAAAQTAFSNIDYTQRQAASQIIQAQGTVGSSRSMISQSMQAVNEARAGVHQAQHQLQEQEANYRKAQADYARYKGADPDAISAQQLDAAEAALKSAEASKNSADAAVSEARSRLAQANAAVTSNVSKLTQSKGVAQGAQAQTLQLNVVKSQYEGAKAAVKSAEDQVRQAQLNLGYTRIVAPVTGRVGKKTVEIGQRVQVGEPLMSVVSPDVWVVANYKETQLTHMRPGQPVTVDVDAFPHHDFTGVVNSFSPASGAQFALLPPENATGNFTKIVQRVPVKILLDAKSLKGYEDLLVPGMSTVVSVHVAEKPRQREAR